MMNSNNHEENEKRKILVLEDDAVLRQLLQMQLGSHDVTLRLAEHGIAAQKEMENFVPDAILCDLFMPQMDGLAFITWLRGVHPDMPVIVMTASHNAEVVKKLEALHIKALFRKPLTPENIESLIEMLDHVDDG